MVDRYFKNNMSIMVGGFAGAGMPYRLLYRLYHSKVTGLTIITNDTGPPDGALTLLLEAGAVKRLFCSFVGLNRRAEATFNKVDVHLFPQGIFVEKIRAGGAELVGIVSRIRGYQKFESALRADLALIKAKACDKAGNLRYQMTDRNFNPTMATAANFVIAEVDRLEDGFFHPETVITPGLYIDEVFYG